MFMEYPLLLNGTVSGRLSVTADGLFTVFSAYAPLSPELIRISVYGGGREGALGLMIPENGVLRLRKRLSKLRMLSFPEHIEYAAESGLAISCDEPAVPDLCHAEITVPVEEDACPGEPETEESDLLWYEAPNGVLTAYAGDRILTALPSALRRHYAGADVRLICGREYVVFFRGK